MLVVFVFVVGGVEFGIVCVVFGVCGVVIMLGLLCPLKSSGRFYPLLCPILSCRAELLRRVTGALLC